ncbi:MAG: hypothetical protein K0R27_2981 [Xanthobacteraceae bacterium]|nr:hypothetical protein [Xanthobacteraceae bacterium]
MMRCASRVVRIIGLSVMAALIAASPTLARAAETVACTAPSELTRAGFSLPLLAKSLKEKTPTTILVLNSTASVAKKRAGEAGAEAVPRSFPSFIEETLKARYPDGGIKVITRNEPRRTAAAVAAALPKLLHEVKPALLIWQTGIYDAIYGADAGDFSDAVTLGIDEAHARGADIIMVGPQFSPRTDFAFEVAPYNATLRWAARAAGVPFFDRYALMRFWDEDRIFDLDAVRPEPSLYENVHRCIGRLLIQMIGDGVDTKTVGSR